MSDETVTIPKAEYEELRDRLAKFEHELSAVKSLHARQLAAIMAIGGADEARLLDTLGITCDARLEREIAELRRRLGAGASATDDLRAVPGATEQVPGRSSGRSTFLDSRLPAYIVFDYLVTGGTIDDFLTEYPSAPRAAVVALLTAVRDYLEAPLP